MTSTLIFRRAIITIRVTVEHRIETHIRVYCLQIAYLRLVSKATFAMEAALLLLGLLSTAIVAALISPQSSRAFIDVFDEDGAT